MSTKDETYKCWKRFSDFKMLAEYAKIADLRDTVTAWTHIQQVRRRTVRKTEGSMVGVMGRIHLA